MKESVEEGKNQDDEMSNIAVTNQETVLLTVEEIVEQEESDTMDID